MSSKGFEDATRAMGEDSSGGSGTDGEGVFTFPDFEDDLDYMKPIEVTEKHFDLIEEAPKLDLRDERKREVFLTRFEPFLNRKGTQGHTVLHTLAAAKLTDRSYQKYTALIELLVKEMPNLLSLRDEDDKTMLHTVVLREQSEVARYLCDEVIRDPNVLSLTQKDGDTCLHIAVRKDLPCAESMVKQIMSKGRNMSQKILNIRGAGGNTPLHIAVDYKRCRAGQDNFVRLLLDASESAIAIENEQGDLAKSSKTGLSPLRYHQESASQFKAEGEKKKGSEKSKMQEAPDPQGKQQRDQKSSGRRRKADGQFLGSKRGPDWVTAKKVEDLLLQHCLRTRPREEAIRILHGPIQRCQIDFDLWNKTEISADDLDGYAGHLAFESVLQYVAIPKLSVKDYRPENWMKEPFWDSAGRKDYLAVFDWLHKKESVKRILRIIVDDNDEHPHSDEAIIQALQPFDVEDVNWRKLDLGSDVILKAAPSVRKLKLYCSGNSAILRGWCAEPGLAQLSKLQSLQVDISTGFESRQAIQRSTERFEEDLHAAWARCRAEGSVEKLSVKWNIVARGKRETAELEQKKEKQHEQRQLWMECMQRFADFIRNFRPSSNDEIVKVGLIDDGVDGTYEDLNHNIKHGQSYSKRARDLWNPYYHSTRGHGTVMARLIREMCPNVKLYVAKLAEQPTDNGVQISTPSAAKAINWAREMGVHVISMSWTIDKVEGKDLVSLQTAIDRAVANNILLFSACDDQGNTKTEIPYPARCNKDKIFRIGAATTWGREGHAVRTESVDYIFPGDDSLIPSQEPPTSLNNVRAGWTASSLATALASGLAALILYCAALRSDNDFKTLRSHEKMRAAFGNIPSPSNYLHVWHVFGDYLKEYESEDFEESKVISKIVDHLLRT